MRLLRINKRKQKQIYIDLQTSVDCWVSPTFTADIYVGLKPGYEGKIPKFAYEIVEKSCKSYCNAIGLAVTLEETHFIYKYGSEPGVKVGLINYPRYPKTADDILKHALALAKNLKDALEQYRVSVVTSDMTYMIGDID